MSTILQDAIRSLQVFGCTNKRQAEKALRSWVRRDLLTADERAQVIAAFGRKRHAN